MISSMKMTSKIVLRFHCCETEQVLGFATTYLLQYREDIESLL